MKIHFMRNDVMAARAILAAAAIAGLGATGCDQDNVIPASLQQSGVMSASQPMAGGPQQAVPAFESLRHKLAANHNETFLDCV